MSPITQTQLQQPALKSGDAMTSPGSLDGKTITGGHKSPADSILFTAVRPDLVMERGEGMYLWDTAGNRYLDFTGGWAVNSLGHSPAALQEALAAKLRWIESWIAKGTVDFGFVNAERAEGLDLIRLKEDKCCSLCLPA
ncbi:aminotransferase class III-fold pyridoxal phosphate-dependent enzyme [Paenibacillus thailandensis]|uniref:aminotransferase class III-fold pyridoxal phosphate-dependent enzyme n=1 Tax=Paenibacillus thailandensis TaxID=393250 RepID=UPI00363B5457